MFWKYGDIYEKILSEMWLKYDIIKVSVFLESVESIGHILQA